MDDDAGAAAGEGARSGPALTYSEVGATASAALPSGYRHLRLVRQIGFGQEWFDEASRRLLTWDMHRRAGLQVTAGSAVVRDQTATLRIGIGPLKVNAPVRVVYLVHGSRERGFAYGTLAGHPEIGEERFTIRLDDDGVVVAEIRAFSRAGRWFTRLGGPVARKAQDVTTMRYLSALSTDALMPCPCCQHRTIPERGTYELCPVCFWEDDPGQFQTPDSPDGANGLSLVDGRKSYQQIGAIHSSFLSKVRPARGSERA